MTRATYRKLKVVWLLGSAVMIVAVIVGWLRMIPIGAVFATIIIFGGAAAVSGWVLRDQKFEELPE